MRWLILLVILTAPPVTARMIWGGDGWAEVAALLIAFALTAWYINTFGD